MLFHISNYEYDNNSSEINIENIKTNLNWSSEFTKKIIKLLEHEKYLIVQNNMAKLSAEGLEAIIREGERLFK